jgi:hypothetical protein
MIGDVVVADAVVHPYNLDPSNQNPAAQPQLDAVYAAHKLAADPEHAEYLLSHDEFFSDVPYEAIASALFVESDVDFALIHSLPNLGFCIGDVTEPRRAAAFRDLHPERFGLYATVDTPVVDTAIAQLESQVRELGVDGLKLYPAFFYDGGGHGWRLDGEDFAVPLIEAAYDMGIRRVAVHKALWLPPAPRDAFNLDDVPGALERFSDIDFYIVHAGMAFLDETVDLLRNHPNMHATLESMFAYILVRPQLFGKILGTLLAAVGSERLLFGSGANLMHPQPILEAFKDYELPEELVQEHGFPQLTDQDRRNILGENALRLHGRDPEALRRAVAGDEYDVARSRGLAPPWDVLRGDRATVAP